VNFSTYIHWNLSPPETNPYVLLVLYLHDLYSVEKKKAVISMEGREMTRLYPILRHYSGI
jgi:hypothetical protein